MTTWITEVGANPAYWVVPVDEVAAALALGQQSAVEHDAEGAVVVVTGRPGFVDEVAGPVR